MIGRLEARIRGDRELAWHPRLELAAVRQLVANQRQLEALRRQLR